MVRHHPTCVWPDGPPCLTFSTDGTRLGAEIAHSMGTAEEAEIVKQGARPLLESDVAEEQADWEGEL